MGPLNPEISDAFTVAPEVVYSPIVPPASFATKRSDPETTIPTGPCNPVTSDVFTVDPEVVYSFSGRELPTRGRAVLSPLPLFFEVV